MAHSSKSIIRLKRFLVGFWAVWWIVTFVFNTVGILQYWALVPGDGLVANYHAVAAALGSDFSGLTGLIFIVSLALQCVVMVSFVRAAYYLSETNWNNYASHAFVMSIIVFMLMYAGYLCMQAVGVDFTQYIDDAVRMVVLQFLCTLFVTQR